MALRVLLGADDKAITIDSCSCCKHERDRPVALCHRIGALRLERRAVYSAGTIFEGQLRGFMFCNFSRRWSLKYCFCTPGSLTQLQLLTWQAARRLCFLVAPDMAASVCG